MRIRGRSSGVIGIRTLNGTAGRNSSLVTFFSCDPIGEPLFLLSVFCKRIMILFSKGLLNLFEFCIYLMLKLKRFQFAHFDLKMSICDICAHDVSSFVLETPTTPYFRLSLRSQMTVDFWE